nr:hypothetical protein OG409_18945 [Streptomyces sp. NBC_00974]
MSDFLPTLTERRAPWVTSVLCSAAWRANFRVDADGALDEDGDPFGHHFVFLLDETPAAAFAEAAAGDCDVAVAVVGGRLVVTLTDVRPARHLAALSDHAITSGTTANLPGHTP